MEQLTESWAHFFIYILLDTFILKKNLISLSTDYRVEDLSQMSNNGFLAIQGCDLAKNFQMLN